jgi:hypothetical protein
MLTEKLKQITWQELKDFVNSIPEEFLSSKVHMLVSDDNEGKKLNEPFCLDEDVYCHKDGFPDDNCGPLEDIMSLEEDYNPDNYEIITKKGTPFLYVDNI